MKHLATLLLLAVMSCTVSAQVARLERVGGDRQIMVGYGAFALPFQVRVVDVNGLPVRGIGVVIGKVTKVWPGPYLGDPFGYRGFNADLIEVNYMDGGFPPNESVFGPSDNDGLVSKAPVVINPTPSAFPVGARVFDGIGSAPIQVFFSAVRVASVPPGMPSVVVEYYNRDADHYFMTLQSQEIHDIDAGRHVGWERSTGAFIAYVNAVDAPAGAVPVCRFFSSKYTSHFYTADAAECDAVIVKWPDVWTLETRSAFHIVLPDVDTGACPAGYTPVYRLYSNRPDPNHRYVTDVNVRNVMVQNGWVAEGYGKEQAIMCTPR